MTTTPITDNDNNNHILTSATINNINNSNNNKQQDDNNNEKVDYGYGDGAPHSAAKAAASASECDSNNNPLSAPADDNNETVDYRYGDGAPHFAVAQAAAAECDKISNNNPPSVVAAEHDQEAAAAAKAVDATPQSAAVIATTTTTITGKLQNDGEENELDEAGRQQDSQNEDSDGDNDDDDDDDSEGDDDDPMAAAAVVAEAEAGAIAPPPIRAIGKESVQRIVAGQAINDLASAVKELVDNALDAGAKNINIRLFDYGLRILEVSDDGCGVPPGESRRYLCQPHATSKIQTLDDIYQNHRRSTLGFRGEALFCLANLSQKVVVATRTANEPLAQKLEYNNDGSLDETSLTDPNNRFAKKVGTTVAVLGLLEKVPVRRKDLERRLSHHRAKLVQWMEAYAIFAVGCRICLMDMVGKNCREQTILATTFHNTTLKDNISSVVGNPTAVQNLCEITASMVDLTNIVMSGSGSGGVVSNSKSNDSNHHPAITKDDESNEKEPLYHVTGLVSKATPSATTSGAGAGTVRQLFAINGRPVELPKLARLLNESWRTITSNTPIPAGTKKNNKPQFFLQLTLPNSCFDINLSPDKRQVHLSHELPIYQGIQSSLCKLWSEQTQGQFVSAGTIGASTQKSYSTQTTLVRPPKEEQQPQDVVEEQQHQKAPLSSMAAAAAAVAELYDSPDEDDIEDRNINNNDGGDDKEGDDDGNANEDNGRADGPTNNSKYGYGGCGDEISPSRFSRRYAFARDVGMMKLQHQYDDGRTKCDSQKEQEKIEKFRTRYSIPFASKKAMQSAAEAAAAAALAEGYYSEEGDEGMDNGKTNQNNNEVAQTSIEDGAHDSGLISEQKRRMTHLHHEAQQGKANGKAGVMPTPSPGQFSLPFGDVDGSSEPVANRDVALSPSSSTKNSYKRTAEAEGMSPADRKRWRAMQQTFNNGSTADGLGQAIEMAAAQVENLTSVATPETATEDLDSSAAEAGEKSRPPSKFGLERFGFRAVSSSSNNNNDEANASVPAATTTAQKRNNRPSEWERIVQIKNAAKNKNNKRPRHVSLPQGDEGGGPEPPNETSTMAQLSHASSGEDEHVVIQKQRIDGGGRRPSPSPSPLPPSVPLEDAEENVVDQDAQQEVVWGSFQSTEDVVLAARREATAVRDRKRRLTEQSEGQDENPDGTGDRIVSLSKNDFREMTVIGQFNLGFILARSKNNDLWILDQHACDEKYNFEKLCAETVIHEQRLICPMSLELSPAEEMCIMDNMAIFEKNGFRFAIDETKPPRSRLSLTGLPHSGASDGRKAVQFGKEDVSALCAILSGDESLSEGAAGGGTGTDGSGMHGNNAVRRYAGTAGVHDTSDKIIARLPKAIAMFASRSCRTSIMIGTSLSQKEMERVVKRLADVEHPWNCPHGRPTMRHVGNLQEVFLQDETVAQEHMAGPTVTFVPTQEEAEAWNV